VVSGEHSNEVKFQVLMVMSMKMTVFRFLVLSSLLNFTYMSEVPAASIIRVKMEAVSTSEMSVNFYQTA
jgi:hypothetical protein